MRTLRTLRVLRDSWAIAHLEPRTAPDGTRDDGGEAGMATAEYAIGTLAAAAFAGLLLAIMRSGGLSEIGRAHV